MNIFSKTIKINDEGALLSKFNDRNSEAFERVYALYFKDITIYASYIFRDTNDDAEDVVQDIFLRLWDNNSVKFDSLSKIKAFLYISVKNAYKNYVKHLSVTQKYIENCEIPLKESAEILEFELYTLLKECMGILPKDCATVLKMYIEGYSPEEISKELGYQIRTVYNKKQEATTILRKKLAQYKFIMLLISQ